MNSLHKYIIVKTLIVFLSSIVFVSILFIGIDISEHIGTFKNFETVEILKYYINLFIVFFTYSGPLCMMISIVIVLTSLKVTNEFGALLTLGVNKEILMYPFKIFSYIILLALIISMEFFLPPAGKNILQTLRREKLEKVKEEEPVLIIDNGKLIGVKRYYSEKRLMKDVILIEEYEEEAPDKILYSKKGKVKNHFIELLNVHNLMKGNSLENVKIQMGENILRRSGILEFLLIYNLYDYIHFLSSYNLKDILTSTYTSFLLLKILFFLTIFIFVKIAFSVATIRVSTSFKEVLSQLLALFIVTGIVYFLIYLLPFLKKRTLLSVSASIFSVIFVFYYSQKIGIGIYNLITRVIGEEI